MKAAKPRRSQIRYYVWKQPSLREELETVKWNYKEDNPYNSWFIYDEVNGLINKTDFLRYMEVSMYLKDELKANNFNIVAAAPKNVFDYPTLYPSLRIKTFQPFKIEGLNFGLLLRKEIVYIEAHELHNDSRKKEEIIEVTFKKIVGGTRSEVIQIRNSKLAELKAKFPNFSFKAHILSYCTYDQSPACFRSVEELYWDHLCEKEELEDEYFQSLYTDSMYDESDS